MRLKLLSYNTLFGGFDGNQRHRADAQIRIITDIQPDILFIQEAKGFDQNGHHYLFELERTLDMRAFLAKAPVTGQNIAIFIREPITTVSLTIDDVHFHHVMISLKVHLPTVNQFLSLTAVHLCPISAELRRKEVAYLANTLRNEELMLIAGDFNSMSPHDPEPQDWQSLPSYHRSRYFADDLQGIDRSVLSYLEAAGWVDVGHTFDPAKTATVPTKAYQDAEFPTMRCDHVLVSKSLFSHVSSYAVIRDETTDFASDHYPILTTFILTDYTTAD